MLPWVAAQEGAGAEPEWPQAEAVQDGAAAPSQEPTPYDVDRVLGAHVALDTTDAEFYGRFLDDRMYLNNPKSYEHG